MGLLDDRSDKTEKPTGKRKSEARDKGNVARSSELSMACLFLAAILVLDVTGSWIVSSLKGVLEHRLTFTPPEESGVVWATRVIRESFFSVLPSILPFLAFLVFATFVVGIAQVGWKITLFPLKPKFTKLNPMNGLKKLFGVGNLVKSGIALLKFLAMGLTLYWNIKDDIPVLLGLQGVSLQIAAPILGNLGLKILWWIAVPLFFISLLDFSWQKYSHYKSLKMSKQEVKDEHKNTEGDPEIKARVRRAQREMALRRMMEEVPRADVVITNPTHFAVALRYQSMVMTAPKVVAKGVDETALKIRDIAKEHRVPIVEDPPLARSLFSGCDLDKEIPQRFYEAVATVLAHVLRLKGEVN